jgi:hypothetical protein
MHSLHSVLFLTSQNFAQDSVNTLGSILHKTLVVNCEQFLSAVTRTI